MQTRSRYASFASFEFRKNPDAIIAFCLASLKHCFVYMDLKDNKKISSKKIADNSELNIPCRNLGESDFEGWLMKKAGGHGLKPISWKKYWCVIKSGNIYCYKTSFESSADYILAIKKFSIEDADEKKKIAFRMKPHEENSKSLIFAGDSETDVKKWIEMINLVISGVDISLKKSNLKDVIPDYEERKRLYSSKQPIKERKQYRASAYIAAEKETTALTGGFNTRRGSFNPQVKPLSNTPETDD
ncbi:connector enhancer of kinase suppressor of ras 2 isoform X2 [Hydra vulgaris]|uniref:connector enhancer of kinase suppressor of ras 2 isoform X2 n=1 Tax=Hydra vulgaris TaxID=6087 RepID=UPI001F5F319C|nr:connector enhancer of kinase suppressor of ras 2 isoform X2 [Hydra vulgaris]